MSIENLTHDEAVKVWENLVCFCKQRGIPPTDEKYARSVKQAYETAFDMMITYFMSSTFHDG